jgi:hypothetical protein
MDIKGLRQNADTATSVIELLGSDPDLVLQNEVLKGLKLDIRQGGPMSLEFLQGFFSGLYLAQNYLGQREGPTPAALGITELTVISAELWLKRIDEVLSK